VQAFIITVPASFGYVKADKLRALAVLSSARLDVWPDTPTIAEAIPGYEASAWDGIGAPIKTPKDIVDKLNTIINKGLADPALKARIKDLGGEPMPMAPAEFAKFIADDAAKWDKVVKFSAGKAN
jgi:tripartite-type tricarboxylate transporter receptor subunit TctC